MDLAKLAEEIEKKIYEVVVREAGGEKRVIRYNPVIRLSESDDRLDVDIELELELSPLAKKPKEEILKAVRSEVDKLIKELTGRER